MSSTCWQLLFLLTVLLWVIVTLVRRRHIHRAWFAWFDQDRFLGEVRQEPKYQDFSDDDLIRRFKMVLLLCLAGVLFLVVFMPLYTLLFWPR
jgi:hypothetical protein